MSGRMIRELSRQQPDLGDADLAGRLVGRAQTYYQAVEHASQTGTFRREAERMGAGSVHICVYHAFVSLHPNDKRAQNAYFSRLVSAAALPKTTFQQGVRDLQSLLSRSQSEGTPTRSRASAQSLSSSAHSTPHRTRLTPSSVGTGTPESARASAKKLLDPKYLSSLRSGADPASPAPASPSKAPTPSSRRRTAPSTPGTPSASRTALTSAALLSTPRAPPAVPPAPQPAREQQSRVGTTPGKRKLPAWGEDGPETQDPDQTARLTSPQKRARVRAALQGAPVALDVDDDDDDDDDDMDPDAPDDVQEDQDEEDGQEQAAERAGPKAREQLLYGPSTFRPPLLRDPKPSSKTELGSHTSKEKARFGFEETRQAFISALLPHALPQPRRSARGHRPVLAISSAACIAPWEDGLLVARERREQGAPVWMAEMDYGRSVAPVLPQAVKDDLRRWLWQNDAQSRAGET